MENSSFLLIWNTHSSQPAKVLPTVGGKQFPWLAICSCVCVCVCECMLCSCGMRNYRLAWLTANALKTSQMSCQCLNVSTATTPSRRQCDAPPHTAPPRTAQRHPHRSWCWCWCRCPATGQTTASTTWVQNSINLLKHTNTHIQMHAYAWLQCVCVCMWAINFMSNQAGNQAAAAAAALAPATAATAAAANETAAMPRKSHVDCPKPQPLKQMSTSFCICHLPHTCHICHMPHEHTNTHTHRQADSLQYLKVPGKKASSLLLLPTRANQSKQLRSDFWLIVSPAHCLIIM